MIRAFTAEDVALVKKIHEKHFKHEFSFPDFLNKFVCAFVVIDEDSNNIIAAGGVRTLAESVLVTNKDYSVRARRTALYEILSASMFVAEKSGHDSLHAFIQDPEWEHHLRRIGFTHCKGKPLYLPLE